MLECVKFASCSPVHGARGRSRDPAPEPAAPIPTRSTGMKHTGLQGHLTRAQARQ